MTLLRIITLYLFDLSMISSENRCPPFRSMLQAAPLRSLPIAGWGTRMKLRSPANFDLATIDQISPAAQLNIESFVTAASCGSVIPRQFNAPHASPRTACTAWLRICGGFMVSFTFTHIGTGRLSS
jgi:hypothetical protein